MAVFGATFFINILFTKFRESPVIMSLAPTTTQLSAFPFPAVTICNMNNVRKSNVASILKLHASRGKTVDKYLIEDFCEKDDEFDFTDSDKNITASWDYIKKLMIEVSQPCHEMLVYCQWYSTKYECSDIFNPALTDEGMCCTFNRVKREFIFKNPKDMSDLNVTYLHESIDWSPERGYPSESPITHLPWRPIGAGSHMGLTIAVDVEADQYYCSSEHSIGFKVLLHNPIETPKLASFASAIRAGSETYVHIMPTIMVSEDRIEDISVEKRQCYFINERHLLYYRSYTQKNCIRECEANFTLTYCGCVLYYMPKDIHTRICGRKDGWCASYAKRVMDISAGDPNYEDKDFKLLKPCVCLPGCHEIGYSMSLSSSPLTNLVEIKPEFIKKHDINYFKENMAIIHLFFTESQFTGILRTRLFGFTEFLCEY
ncbi:hypothetical protein AAG570_012146 [Ranatra chinensis]|uniref:Uncharacterized protein n=1 Tax=Ranatra chinensis TaxID=642074 RepID=A0ABD0YHY1_9HEMI